MANSRKVLATSESSLPLGYTMYQWRKIGNPLTSRMATAPSVPSSVKVCNDKGEVVSELVGHRVLHVASGRPVALVHAELILPRPPDAPPPSAPPLDALRSLVDEGFELVYFDIHEKNRDALIHDELVKQRLPPGGILIYSAEELLQ